MEHYSKHSEVAIVLKRNYYEILFLKLVLTFIIANICFISILNSILHAFIIETIINASIVRESPTINALYAMAKCPNFFDNTFLT